MATTIFAIGDGITDNTANINNALNTGQPIYFPPGNYATKGGHLIMADGQCILGDASGSVKINNTDPLSNTFTTAPHISGSGVRGITVTRSVPAMTGAIGINFPSICNYAVLDDVISENNWHGFSLGPTGFSTGSKLIAQYNLGVGFLMQNSATNGSCQWSFDDAAALQNGGQGFYVQAVIGPSAGVTMGTWKTITTFANSGCGIAVVGLSGTPINGFRIHGGFIGADGNHELYLDTYGSLHVIDDVFMELAGKEPTGPKLVTAASGIGNGIYASDNNPDVTIRNVRVNGCSQFALTLLGAASGYFINGVRTSNCGKGPIFMDDPVPVIYSQNMLA